MYKKNPDNAHIPKNNEISISYVHKAENGVEMILFLLEMTNVSVSVDFRHDPIRLNSRKIR